MIRLFLLLFSLVSLSCTKDSSEPEETPSTGYFLVGEKSAVHQDSYVIRTDDPARLTEIRSWLAKPLAERPLVLTDIKKTGNSPSAWNKDLVTKGRIWNWEPAGEPSLVDFTIEIYDGWPVYVQENLEEWIRITQTGSGNGRIGFWNYTLIREVTSAELGIQ